MLIDLKPCPFCGGKARLSTFETESLWSHNIVTYTKVGCDECDYFFQSEPGFEVEAPARWNTRSESDARMQRVVEAATEAEQRLTQALGIIVEFGDLNGFRNLTDQELGASVIQMAQACSATLDRLRAALSQAPSDE